jgi:hypothetical protein
MAVQLSTDGCIEAKVRQGCWEKKKQEDAAKATIKAHGQGE